MSSSKEKTESSNNHNSTWNERIALILVVVVWIAGMIICGLRIYIRRTRQGNDIPSPVISKARYETAQDGDICLTDII